LHLQLVFVLVNHLPVYVCFISEYLIIILIGFVLLVLVFSFVMRCIISTIMVAFEMSVCLSVWLSTYLS